MTIGKKILDERGCQQWYPFSPRTVDPVATVNPVISKAIKEIEENRLSYPPMPDPDIALDGHAGWITLDGKFYSCQYRGHIDLADALTYNIRKIESPNPERDAELLGWIKVAHTLENGRPHHYLLMHEAERKMTFEQAKTLTKWCETHKQELPYWFDDKNPET